MNDTEKKTSKKAIHLLTQYNKHSKTKTKQQSKKKSQHKQQKQGKNKQIQQTNKQTKRKPTAKEQHSYNTNFQTNVLVTLISYAINIGLTLLAQVAPYR